MNLRYEVLLEEFQVDINLRLAVALHLLVFVSYGFLGEPLDRLLKNRMQDLLKHLPRVCDLVHDLAEHLETQEHVEDDLGVVGQDLVLGDHLSVHALIEDAFLRLVFDVFNALLQVSVFCNPLQSVVVGNQEIIFIRPIELTLTLIIVLDLRLDFLELLVLVIVDLLQKQLFQFHPSVDADFVVEDVLVGAHRDTAGSFSHEERSVLVVEAW